ncbi:spore germination protein [Desulfitobacterium metallireducens]|nr:spore germination protein [Desulfitobacterium metallireducens]
MIKDLTLRPHTRRIRKPPVLPIDQEREKPLSYKIIREELEKSSDIVFREFSLRAQEEIPCELVVVDGLIDKSILNDFILRVLMVDLQLDPDIKKLTQNNIIDNVLIRLAPANEIKKIDKMGEALDGILSGDAVLFFENLSEALVIGARGWASRAVSEPQIESSIRGPQEGFTETLRTNTSLLRRRIKHPSLRIVSLKLGDLTHTDVVVCYVDKIVNSDVLSEVLRRLSRIKVDGVVAGDSIEEMIEDSPYSSFPTVYHTERPDVITANLLEGRVAIMADGTPTALLVPITLSKLMQVNEDYYERAMIIILIRFVRYLGATVSVLAPSIYIAVTTFHQEILPTSLALSIAAGREGVPFPALGEALLMTLSLEILQEAGLRLPKPVGQTIGIVGALVIGDAAVKASLVSPLMVIVIGITAVASYTIPAYDLGIAVRLIRFPLMLLAGTMGFYGVGVGLYAGLIHVLSIRSFGVPYLSPIAPLRIRALLQDTFARAPWWAMKRRPELIDVEDPNSSSGGTK